MGLNRILLRSGSLVLLGLAGCESKPASPELGYMQGQVISLEERAPVAGARLVLVDASRNAASSSVAVSDAQGRYRIDSIPSGWHYLVVQAGRNVVYDPFDGAFVVTAGSRLTREVVVAPYPFFTRGPVVKGRVVDEATGEPLAAASVSVGSTSLQSLFSGLGSPWEALTDHLGEFQLTEVPVAYLTTGDPLGIVPVVASRSGYLPGGTGSFLRHEWIPLPAVDDTAFVEIRLRPGSGAARVQGVVTWGGRGAAGVPVALALIDTAAGALPAGSHQRLDTKSMMPHLLATSDAAGQFEITGIPTGRYTIQAGYLPDDGWIATPAPAVIVPINGSTVKSVDLAVLRAVTLVQPAAGAVVSTGQPLLVWRKVPDAEFYRVSFSQANSFVLGNSIATADTSLVMPAGYWGDGDYARWSVDAFDDDRLIGSAESIDSFRIESRNLAGPDSGP